MNESSKTVATSLQIVNASQDELEKFFKKVNKTDHCWNWTAATDTKGYGKFSFRGRLETASRVSWTMYFRAIPPGLIVCHKCDNPACVNPAHLFVGTYKDNSQDMVNKGRSIKGMKWKPEAIRRGERHSGVKFLEQDVKTMRHLCKAYSRNGVAAIFGVHIQYLGLIIRGKRWNHI